MKLSEIYNFLDSLSPFELQEPWDNSGLLVGSFSDEIEKIYLSIDLDLDLVDKIEEKSLIITHHPLIFKGLKSVNYDSYSTKILKELIKKDIALISMHTNIDKTHLNYYVAKEVLGLEITKKEDFVVYAQVNKSFEEFSKDILEKLGINQTKVVKAKEFIKSVALTTGSGMSLLEDIKADCFLTGDIKYHDAMEAKARGVSLIDIGHYESERYFDVMLEELLSSYLKINKLKAIISSSKNPFEFFNKGETIE